MFLIEIFFMQKPLDFENTVDPIFKTDDLKIKLTPNYSSFN